MTRRRDHRDEAGQPGDQSELGVGLDEVPLVAHDRRHERLLGHEVGLLEDERGEHQREQGEVVDRRGHQQRDHDARRRDQLDDGAPAAGGAVDDRPDQRGDDHERGEADDEEEEHPTAGRARVDAEEQRVGERDDHRRVATDHRRVGDAQTPELRNRSPSRHGVRC